MGTALSKMRILIDSGTYNLRNVGDTTMLQTGVSRLRTLFPHASIQVFTNVPDDLAYTCPGVTPLSTSGRSAWVAEGYLFGQLYKPIENGRISRGLKAFERKFRCRWPALARFFIERSARRSGIQRKDLDEFLEAVSKANFVVITGMGGLTDVFRRTALGFLDTLDLAIQRGVPTAMFGQGIGPIDALDLFARAKEVLPMVNLISLREGRASLPLLKSLGVLPERIRVTGDDAIEFAYVSRTERLGRGLGVNLRVAKYSQIGQVLVECIRPILQDFARANRAPLIPVPISWVPGEEDWISIRQLVKGFEEVFIKEDDPDKQKTVIHQLHQCRVVVTGSYHGAVFALAQGIPSVGLAKTRYYLDKFLGLAEEFGVGCQVINLDDVQIPVKLHDAIDRLWNSAEELRPKLLETASSQIDLSRTAYRQVQKLVLS
jgi:colanic acid/amylovoran biosynthesis protein